MNQHQKPLALAVNYINEMMATECIFCFGTRKGSMQIESIFADAPQKISSSIHFDLLAITTNACAVEDFIGPLENIPGLDFTVSLITLTRAGVNKALKENNRFFHSVIKNGRLVDSNIGKRIISIPVPFDEETDYQKTLTYWETKYLNAISYSDLAFNSSNNEQIAIPLLNKSMVQICEGLIFVFFGYQPKDYELSELIELCNSIDLDLQDFLPMVTERDLFHYQVLMQAYLDADQQEMEPNVGNIHQCCIEFTKFAKSLCEHKLHLVESE